MYIPRANFRAQFDLWCTYTILVHEGVQIVPQDRLWGMLRLTHLLQMASQSSAGGSTVLKVNLRAPPRHCYHPFATIMRVKYVMKITAESTNENGTKHIKFISDIAEYKRIVTSNIPRPFLTPSRRSPVSFTARRRAD